MEFVTRRIPRRCARNIRALSTAHDSRPTYPFNFHIGASFAGKPRDELHRRVRTKHPSFPSDTPIGKWRDAMLARPRSVPAPNADETHAGEDFYFVQQVRVFFVRYDVKRETNLGCE
jgi:protein phosphatase PTC7